MKLKTSYSLSTKQYKTISIHVIRVQKKSELLYKCYELCRYEATV